MNSSLMQIAEAEREAKINRAAEIIQQVFDSELKDRRGLEKIYNIDSLYRSNVGIQFRSLMGTIETLKKMDPCMSFSLQERYEILAITQWLIDVTLQLISRQLTYLFDVEQKSNREQIEDLVKNGAGFSVPKGLLQEIADNKKRIADNITKCKLIFDEFLALAKDLAFEIFDEDVYRYHWYRALNTDRREYYNSAKLKEAERQLREQHQ